MAWSEFNARTLFPGPTQAVLETTGAAAETVAEAAEVIADGLDTLADFLSQIPETPLAIIEALKNLISDALSTGLYLYHDVPSLPLYSKASFSWDAFQDELNIDWNEEQRRQAAETAGEDYTPSTLGLEPSRTHGCTGWTAKWKKSFYDAGDAGRPEFSEDAAVTCVIFMAGTPSIDVLPTLLKALGTLLGIGAWKDLLDSLLFTRLTKAAVAGDRAITVARPEIMVVDREVLIGPLGPTSTYFEFAHVKSIDETTGEVSLYHPLKNDYASGKVVAMTAMSPSVAPPSRAPDWWSIQARDLEPFKSLERQIKRLLGLLDIGEGILALLAALAKALADKADELRQLADEIVELIELIEDIISLTGVYIIKLESSTGIEGLFDALENEGNPPLPAGSFVAGACILAGTADFAGFGDMLGV